MNEYYVIKKINKNAFIIKNNYYIKNSCEWKKPDLYFEIYVECKGKGNELKQFPALVVPTQREIGQAILNSMFLEENFSHFSHKIIYF